MKDLNNRSRADAGGIPASGRAISERLSEIRSSPSLMLTELLSAVLGFLFARCHVAFGARPLAIGLLALFPSGVFSSLIGSVIGALSLGTEGAPYAVICCLTVALRIMISSSSEGESRIFGESLLMRMCEATVSGFVLAVYRIILGGFGAETLLFALTVTLLPPVVCFALSGIFDLGVTLPELFGGERSRLSFEGRSERERYALIFFHLSAALLSLLIALSLSPFEIFGFSFAYVWAAAAALLISHRFGAVRGAIMGLVTALPLSAMQAVALALAGAAAGALFPLGGLYGVGAGALLLSLWGAYTGGAMSILEALPEYAVGGAIMLPFVNKTLQKEPKKAEKPPQNNAGEMVGTMTLAYRSRPSISFDSLEEALVGISSAARGFEVGSSLREEELREMVLSYAKGSVGEVARELCIEKSAVIAARLKSGQSLTAAMLGVSDDPDAEELCRRISSRAAEMEEERYRQSLTAGRYEDYRLISKLLNESRADCERERALDHDLSDRLALLFTECGLSDVVVKVFGERRRHLIAAGEDPDGSLITSPELHAGIEKLLDARLGEAEYFRRGTTALIEVEAARRLSAESAVATIQGSSGEVSGDVSCAFTSKDGYFYSLLSDGMGSGELARETADFVTKFLSYLLRTGGFRDTALCLLNNIVRRRGEECSATIDLFELDLIRGDALFIKSGAAPSYVKRGSSIFRIRSETAPIGLMNQVDAERMRAEVREGDYVIMLSDGVSSTPEDAPWLLELLTEPPRRSLKEYAELILSEAVKNSSSGDDMTVLVTKISADSDRRA